jgi:MFS superfamily sulfate permease-like transporter
LIFGIQRFIPKLPAALTAVVVSSVIVAVLNPGIDLVAQIPQGLPSIAIPTGIDASTWLNLLLAGAVVALVGFSEGWGASGTISKKTHDDLDTNQEFRAYGIGNIGASLLGGMVVTGSLSKSAAAMAAGAKSQMSNIFLALFVLLMSSTPCGVLPVPANWRSSGTSTGLTLPWPSLPSPWSSPSICSPP